METSEEKQETYLLPGVIYSLNNNVFGTFNSLLDGRFMY